MQCLKIRSNIMLDFIYENTITTLRNHLSRKMIIPLRRTVLNGPFPHRYGREPPPELITMSRRKGFK